MAYVDASAWGWGATIEEHGAVRCRAFPWSADDRLQHKISSSVVAEPLALRLLLCCILSASRPGLRIKVFSDHAPLVWRAARGHADTWAYNEVCRAIESAWCVFGTSVVVAFVRGAENRADALSRGLVAPSIVPWGAFRVGCSQG